MEILFIPTIFVPLLLIGFSILVENPLWIFLFIALLASTVLISYAFHRHRKHTISGFARTLTRDLFLFMGLLLVGAPIGAEIACTSDPDPFCLFGAAPLLSCALMVGLLAGMTSLVGHFIEKKKLKSSRVGQSPDLT